MGSGASHLTSAQLLVLQRKSGWRPEDARGIANEGESMGAQSHCPAASWFGWGPVCTSHTCTHKCAYIHSCPHIHILIDTHTPVHRHSHTSVLRLTDTDVHSDASGSTQSHKHVYTQTRTFTHRHTHTQIPAHHTGRTHINGCL